MSDFTNTGTNEPAAEIIENPWFGDIDINIMRDVMRIDRSITNARLRANAKSAILETNQTLKAYKDSNIEYGSLANIPADIIDFESIITYMYTMAVYHNATAKMLDEMRGYDTNRKAGEDRMAVTTLLPNSANHMRMSRAFVKRIQGKQAIDVDLI